MIIDPSIFKDYDIRATVPDQLDEQGMYQLGLAINKFIKPQEVAIGRDARTSGPMFQEKLTQAFTNSGVNVIDLGVVTTDMTYYASGLKQYDLSLMITASHNPSEWNGLKITKKGAVAVSGDSGIYDIRDLATGAKIEAKSSKQGSVSTYNILDEWINHCLTFVDITKIKPLKVLFDAGNGVAGVSVNKIKHELPIELTRMYFEPDGTFPNHLPYPLQEDNIKELKEKMATGNYDLGVAADGDADRMFFVDEKGKFVSGSTITAIVAEYLLKKDGPDTIIYNAICGKIVPEIIKELGGKPIRWRVGHSLLKEKMLVEKAKFAGEHSGHYFFRENYNADGGLIVFLIVLQLVSESNMPFSEYLEKYRKYPSSGEINFRVKDKDRVMKQIENDYGKKAESIDWLDGITVWFNDWWFNVRPSNTQPLLRLNVEVNTPNTIDINTKINELVQFIEGHDGKRVVE